MNTLFQRTLEQHIFIEMKAMAYDKLSCGENWKCAHLLRPNKKKTTIGYILNGFGVFVASIEIVQRSSFLNHFKTA